METLSLTLTQEEINELKARHAHAKIRYDLAYTQFQLKGSDYTITVYKTLKVVFQGSDLDTLVSGYIKKKQEQPPTLPMAGSDEVGTGDYFGPITVCACIVTQDNYDALPIQRIMDSKMMSDKVIAELAPQLMKHLDYSLLVLDNSKYNIIHKANNMNRIKAKLHNQAYIHLSKKASIPALAVVDQFMPQDRYFLALRDTKNVYTKLHFETKAENKYIAVACASIIARYAFLDAMNQLGEHYGTVFPKGASALVDQFGKTFVDAHGVDELKNVAKFHFQNTKRIIGS